MRKLYYVLLISFFAIITTETSAQNTYVPDDNFEQALIDLGYDTGVLDDYVPTANINGVIYLTISSKSIQDLTGIQDFTALKELYCGFNQLTNLDISANTNLTHLHCQSNQLTSIDISANVALTAFTCSSNQISSLNVSANTELVFIGCNYNQLTSLDVSANTALISLECYYNQLTSLDVSLNTALTYLYCYENQITSLNVSTNNDIIELWCSSNQLSSLNVSGATALTLLSCNNNQLTNLDLTSNISLETLECNSNQLTNLDLSANTSLLQLYCYSNQLTNFDIRNGNNANMTYFAVSGNPDLTCIYVDDKDAAYLSGWYKDATSNFVNNETECLAFMTYIPDNNFEQALIDFGFDSGDLDDYVPTASIDTVTSIDVSAESISDLTGIEDFIALTELDCSDNQLTVLDFRNGNNANITSFDASDNSDLACIYVDDKTASYLSDWTIDAASNFVNDEADCSAITTIAEIIAKEDYTIYPNPTNGILKFDFSGNYIRKIKISDITGKTVFEKVNVEQNEVVDLSDFANGIYLVILQTENGISSSKIIKE